MKLTKSALQEYVEIDVLIKNLERKRQTIREMIKAKKSPEFRMGDFLVSTKPFERHIPEHDQKGVRIEVRKVA